MDYCLACLLLLFSINYLAVMGLTCELWDPHYVVQDLSLKYSLLQPIGFSIVVGAQALQLMVHELQSAWAQ